MSYFIFKLYINIWWLSLCPLWHLIHIFWQSMYASDLTSFCCLVTILLMFNFLKKSLFVGGLCRVQLNLNPAGQSSGDISGRTCLAHCFLILFPANPLTARFMQLCILLNYIFLFLEEKWMNSTMFPLNVKYLLKNSSRQFGLGGLREQRLHSRVTPENIAKWYCFLQAKG